MALDTIRSKPRVFTGRGRNVKRSSRWFGRLFWWTMLIILLALGAVASWTFCIFAFSHPEKPMNYWVLNKFNKLEAPKSFSNSNAPKNKSYTARDLYDRFQEYEDRHFKEMNGLLMRNYIENFERAEPGFTMNMVGKFEIEKRRALGEKDVIMSGTVLLARCVDFPDVVIEYLMPGKPGSVPDDVLKEGDVLDLGTKSRSRFAPFNVVLHVTRNEGNQYCFCIVPIVFSRAHLARGLELDLAPPKILNLDGTLPPPMPEGGKDAVEEEETSEEEGGSLEEPVVGEEPAGE